jgi:hypothetical protein
MLFSSRHMYVNTSDLDPKPHVKLMKSRYSTQPQNLEPHGFASKGHTYAPIRHKKQPHRTWTQLVRKERERERVEPLCSTRYGGVDRHHNAEESLPTSSCLCVPHLQDATDYLLHSAHKAPPKTTPWLPTCFQSTNQESQQITTTTPPPPPRPQTINTYLLLQTLSTSYIFEQILHYRGL